MEGKLGRREQKKIQSRQAIMKAAVEEFGQKGYREASIADIMRRAGFGIGTFYNYFQTKEEILFGLLVQLVDDVNREIETMRADHCSARDMLAKGCEVTAVFLDGNRFVLPLFLSASDHSGRPEMPHDTNRPAPRVKTVFTAIIREGQENGEIRRDVPADLIAEMFHSLYQAAAFSRLNLSFQENVALKTKLLLDGIRPQS